MELSIYTEKIEKKVILTLNAMQRLKGWKLTKVGGGAKVQSNRPLLVKSFPNSHSHIPYRSLCVSVVSFSQHNGSSVWKLPSESILSHDSDQILILCFSSNLWVCKLGKVCVQRHCVCFPLHPLGVSAFLKADGSQ